MVLFAGVREDVLATYCEGGCSPPIITVSWQREVSLIELAMREKFL